MLDKQKKKKTFKNSPPFPGYKNFQLSSAAVFFLFFFFAQYYVINDALITITSGLDAL